MLAGFPLPNFDLDEDDDNIPSEIDSPLKSPQMDQYYDRKLCQEFGIILNDSIRCTGNSTVYAAQSSYDGNIYAVKITEHKKQVKDEYEKRGRLPDSPYLVKTISLTESPKKSLLKMELCEEGDIQGLYFDEMSIWVMIHDIGEALYQIHSHGWIHLDVSPGNILVTHDAFKLADFGTLTPIGRFEEGCEGAGPYCSPETLAFPYGEPVGTATDIFSFGIVLLEAASHQKAPRGGCNNYVKLRKGELKLGDSHYKTDMSLQLIALINAMLSPSPQDRPSSDDILMHPHVQNPYF